MVSHLTWTVLTAARPGRPRSASLRGERSAQPWQSTRAPGGGWGRRSAFGWCWQLLCRSV